MTSAMARGLTVWLLDSSSLIRIKSHVPGAKQWALLKAMESMVADGTLTFAKQVKDEVTGLLHPDAPGVWAAGVYHLMAYDADPGIAYVKHVMGTEAAAVVDPDKTTEDADPYVIALALELMAMGHDVRVVTNDQNDTPARIAMSKACDITGVDWCGLEEFLVAVGH